MGQPALVSIGHSVATLFVSSAITFRQLLRTTSSLRVSQEPNRQPGFSHTGGITGGEVGIAGGSAVLAQRILEAIFGDQAVRDMADQARHKLMAKAEELYAGEQVRLHAAVAAVEVSAGQAVRLEAASSAVEAAR